MQQQQQQQQQNKLKQETLLNVFSQFCNNNFQLNIPNIIENISLIMQEKNENWQADIKNLYNQSFNEQNIKNYFDQFNILSKDIDQQNRDFDICLINPFLNNNNNNNNNNINNSECSIIALSDVHSDLESIKTIYNFLTKNTKNNNYLIFNGDYTNRDLQETENTPSVIMFFIATSLGLYTKLHPNESRVFFNIGNHETASIIGSWAQKLLSDSNKNISKEQILDSQLFENEDNNILSKFKLQIAEMYNKSMFLEIIFRDEIIFKHSAGIDMYEPLAKQNKNQIINIIPVKIIIDKTIDLNQTKSTASIEDNNNNNLNNDLISKNNKTKRLSLSLNSKKTIEQFKKYFYDQQHQNEEDENNNNNTKVNQIEINSIQSNSNRRDNKYKFDRYGTCGIWSDPSNKNFFSEYFVRDGINLNDKKEMSDLFYKLYSQFYKKKIPIIKIIGHSNGNINEFYDQKTNSIKSKTITENNQSSFFDQIQIDNNNINNNNLLFILLPAFYKNNILQNKNILEKKNAQNTNLQIKLFSNDTIILNNIKLP